MDEQIVVFRVQNTIEAQLVKDILGARGIEAFVFDDHLSSLNPLLVHALGGIRIVVRQKDCARAERVLRKSLKAGLFTGNISPLGQMTAETDAVRPANYAALCVIAAFLLFVAALFFFSPGRIAVLFHRTIPMLLTRQSHTVRVRSMSPETRAGMNQPLEVLLKKAQSGDGESQYYLGWKYYFGNNVEKSESTAIQWIQKAAENGFIKAQYSIGNIYRYGISMGTDEKQAFQWYLKAAQQGYPKAQVAVGVDYYSGRGMPRRDEAMAIEWFQKAADQGYAPAQNFLGFAYEQGEGIPQDYGKAIEWFKRSSSQGDEEGEARLAYCYLMGTGVETDYSQAATLFEKAALQGDPSAQYNMGTLYESGKGVPKNMMHAYAWFLVSASHKHAGGIEAAVKWEGRLSKKEIGAGHSLAADLEKQIDQRSGAESEDGSNPQ